MDNIKIKNEIMGLLERWGYAPVADVMKTVAFRMVSGKENGPACIDWNGKKPVFQLNSYYWDMRRPTFKLDILLLCTHEMGHIVQMHHDNLVRILAEMKGVSYESLSDDEQDKLIRELYSLESVGGDEAVMNIIADHNIWDQLYTPELQQHTFNIEFYGEPYIGVHGGDDGMGTMAKFDGNDYISNFKKAYYSKSPNFSAVFAYGDFDPNTKDFVVDEGDSKNEYYYQVLAKLEQEKAAEELNAILGGQA